MFVSIAWREVVVVVSVARGNVHQEEEISQTNQQFSDSLPF